jgi:hypothetical protein
MKIIAILALACFVFGCRESWKWVESEEYDLIKSKIIFENKNVYIYPDSGKIIAVFQTDEYPEQGLREAFKGYPAVSLTDHSVTFDSAEFDLIYTKQFFSDFTNKRMR